MQTISLFVTYILNCSKKVYSSSILFIKARILNKRSFCCDDESNNEGEYESIIKGINSACLEL